MFIKLTAAGLPLRLDRLGAGREHYCCQRANQEKHLTEETSARLSLLDRWLLDVGDKWQ